MKKIFLVALLAVSSQLVQAQKSNRLRGKWQVISASGGFTGKGPGWDLEAPVIFEFCAGKFRSYEKGKMVSSDKYAQIKSKTQFSDSLNNVLDFANLPDLVWQIRKDTLYLNENVNDGFSYVLKKKK